MILNEILTNINKANHLKYFLIMWLMKKGKGFHHISEKNSALNKNSNFILCVFCKKKTTTYTTFQKIKKAGSVFFKSWISSMWDDDYKWLFRGNLRNKCTNCIQVTWSPPKLSPLDIYNFRLINSDLYCKVYVFQEYTAVS